MSETFAPIEEGALVRLTRDVDGYGAGFQFVIDEYVEPRPEAEREAGEIDAPIYYGNANGGSGNVCVPADAVEVVKSAAVLAARKLPTAEQITEALSIDSWDLEFDEWTKSGNTVEVYGRTEDGLTFGFTLTVSRPWNTDL